MFERLFPNFTTVAMTFHSFYLLTLLALSTHVQAASYSQTDSYIGADFINRFSFDTESDPTHGRVNYVDEATAVSDNLTFVTSNSFIARADFTTTLSASGAGRNSVRLQSNTYYSTSTMVIDLAHMPEGCGTWPAIWTLGDDWPENGEIDIVEGVNNQATNQATLHTDPGCTMPATRAETGTVLETDCDASANGNAGCGVSFASGSFGPTFNSNGGGWYAMERTTDFIKVWFWARNSGSVPSDVSSGSTEIDTDNWGTPVAYFPNTSCAISSLFGAHRIIINLTFCGDWAGNTYSTSGCPSTCVDYVNNNPSAFTNAFFEIGSIRVYE